jgi:hypothetical protein
MFLIIMPGKYMAVIQAGRNREAPRLKKNERRVK